jgi:hypothetical protein
MRLGQLARKLAVKQNELVDFLAQKNIHIGNGGNTKIEEAHLALLIEKFAPAGLELSASEISEPDVIEESQKPADSQPIFDVAANEDPSPATSNVEDEKIELIKAPKIELSGLKVLGKIELPELKKKEPAAESPEGLEPPERKPRRDFNQPRKERNQSRSTKNPIATERERQAREEENKRKEQAALEKEKKTLRYMKKMNAVQPTKAVRTFHEREETVQAAPPPRPEPKTAWGKFLRWLNT